MGHDSHASHTGTDKKQSSKQGNKTKQHSHSASTQSSTPASHDSSSDIELPDIDEPEPVAYMDDDHTSYDYQHYNNSNKKNSSKKKDSDSDDDVAHPKWHNFTDYIVDSTKAITKGVNKGYHKAVQGTENFMDDMTDITDKGIDNAVDITGNLLSGVTQGASDLFSSVSNIGSTAVDTIAEPVEDIAKWGLVGLAVLGVGGYLLWQNTSEVRGDIYASGKEAVRDLYNNKGKIAAGAGMLLI